MTLLTNWTEILGRQKEIYGLAWAAHLDAVNAELKDLGADIQPRSFIAFYWNQPRLRQTPPKDVEGKVPWPPFAPNASSRTAALLANGWLKSPHHVLPEDSQPNKLPIDPREENRSAIDSALLGIGARRYPNAAQEAWVQVLAAISDDTTENWNTAVTRLRDAADGAAWEAILLHLAAADVECDDLVSGGARSRWMGKGIDTLLAIRVRARALVDAYAVDAAAAAGIQWEPRVLLRFPNTPRASEVGYLEPGVSVAEWKMSPSYRGDRIADHDAWTSEFINDLSAQALAEVSLVEQLRADDNRENAFVLMGVAPKGQPQPPDDEVAASVLLGIRDAVLDACQTGSLDPGAVFTTAAAIIEEFKRGPGAVARSVLVWFGTLAEDADETAEVPSEYARLEPSQRQTACSLISGTVWAVIYGMES